MSAKVGPTEAWKSMVLRSMPLPAWLATHGLDTDVVVSSRVRIARNLRGHRFPHHAGPEELRETLDLISVVVRATGIAPHVYRGMTDAERDYLVGCRLISPDFDHRSLERAVFLDDARALSVLVNEEDHIRLQALTAGWRLSAAEELACRAIQRLSRALPFAHAAPWGFLTASPSNRGSGRRSSALFHLIGLAHSGRLQSVLNALAERGIHVRGLFGEQSRAVGAFFQISRLGGSASELTGAGEYLIAEERRARRDASPAELRRRTKEAVDFALRSTMLSLADALKILAWVRWAGAAGIHGSPPDFRQVDLWVSTMEVRGSNEPKSALVERAAFLRERLEASMAAK